ncbi:hypothetical protein Pmani_022974 [Petrolisthes manimaculis]|uniref:Uncharacterized protein n=1 Tax=Petrolisthes manimaculis TaxID=1843537 RepID=A0AAE1U029_9EUCA|nr:hypothetical protein Pmani_022974 [Petrolisthes manimaculis]
MDLHDAPGLSKKWKGGWGRWNGGWVRKVEWWVSGWVGKVERWVGEEGGRVVPVRSLPELLLLRTADREGIVAIQCQTRAEKEEG